MPLNKQLFEILICPQCHGKVRLDEKLNGIVCDQCKLVYEIKDDIPIMLVEEAKKISQCAQINHQPGMTDKSGRLSVFNQNNKIS